MLYSVEINVSPKLEVMNHRSRGGSQLFLPLIERKDKYQDLKVGTKSIRYTLVIICFRLTLHTSFDLVLTMTYHLVFFLLFAECSIQTSPYESQTFKFCSI